MSEFGVSNFSGGMNNFINPKLLQSNSQVLLENAIVDTGALISTQKSVIDDETDYSDNFELSFSNRSVVQWGNNKFWSDNETGELDSSIGYMGVEPPQDLLVASPSLLGDRFRGQYQYLMTYETTEGFESGYTIFEETFVVTVNASVPEVNLEISDIEAFNRQHVGPWRKGYKYWGYEVDSLVQYEGLVYKNISKVSNGKRRNLRNPDVNSEWKNVTAEYQIETISGHQEIILSAIPQSSQTDVAFINIYRTISNGSTFYKLVELEHGELSYRDSTGDEALQVTLDIYNPSDLRLPPIYDIATDSTVGGKFLTEVDSVFYLAVGEYLYASDKSNPHSWDPKNRLTFPAPITTIAKDTETHTASRILVMTNNQTFVVSGSSLLDFEKAELPIQHGCPNFRTLSYLNNAPIWFSQAGVLVGYFLNEGREGRGLQLLTARRFETSEKALFSMAGNDVYYLVTTDTAYKFNFLGEMIISQRSFTAESGAHDGDNFIIKQNDVFYKLDQGEQEEFIYLSPEIKINNETFTSRFRRMIIDSSSDVEVEVFIDSILSFSALIKRENKDIRRFYLSNCFGKIIQIKLSGIGELNSYVIQYATKGGSEDGR